MPVANAPLNTPTGPDPEEPPEPLELAEVPLELLAEVPLEPPLEPPAELPLELPLELLVDRPLDVPLELPAELLLLETPLELPADRPLDVPLELPEEPPLEPVLDVPLELPAGRPLDVPPELLAELPLEPVLDAPLELLLEELALEVPPELLLELEPELPAPPLELPLALTDASGLPEPAPASMPAGAEPEDPVPHALASPSAIPRAAASGHVVFMDVLPSRGIRRSRSLPFRDTSPFPPRKHPVKGIVQGRPSVPARSASSRAREAQLPSRLAHSNARGASPWP
jgi:hypothetical protein